jgi:hypothetical protein
MQNVVSRILQINVNTVVYSVYVHRVGGVSRTEPLSLSIVLLWQKRSLPFCRGVVTDRPEQLILPIQFD